MGLTYTILVNFQLDRNKKFGNTDNNNNIESKLMNK